MTRATLRRYEILSVLGKGGFGTVYRARLLGDGGFSKAVALKLLHPHLSSLDEMSRRLRDEARLLGLLRHRAVVQVDALVRLAGRWTIVMELVEGRDLGSTLDSTGPLPLPAALELSAEVAGALHSGWTTLGEDGEPLRLHHRDIKPGNICLTGQGEVKVLDFGIARADFVSREANTQAGAFGTVDYMAPERFLPEVHQNTDVYSLGVVLFETLAARRFGRASADPTLHQRWCVERLDHLVDDRPEVEAVRPLLLSMLAPRPQDRPTAREVERRCLELCRTLPGQHLRDWAEEHIPPLVEAQRAVADAITGTILFESQDAGEGPPEGKVSPTHGFASPTMVPTTEDEPPVLVAPPSTAPPTRSEAPARGYLLPVLTLALGALSAVFFYSQREITTLDPPPSRPAQPAPPPPEPAPRNEAPPAPESAQTAPEPAQTAPEPAQTVPEPAQTAPPTPPEPAVPSVSPRPAPDPRPTSPPQPTEDSPVQGIWTGSFAGSPFEMQLQGSPDRLEGALIVRNGPNSVQTRVSGSYDPLSRNLRLEDQGTAPDAARYELKLAANLQSFRGSAIIRASGDRVQMTGSR